MEGEKTIIEVNGVKLEVDLRHARRVDELRVGDRVKVLNKDYSGYKVHAGTVIGFEPFKNLPTIIVAYLEKDYTGANVKFLHFNAESNEIEIIKAIDDDSMDIDKAGVLRQLDGAIAKKRAEIEDIARRRAYFLENIQAYWAPV